MNTKQLYAILIYSMLLLSCTSNETGITPEETNPIVITNIQSSKEFAFIENTLTLNIDASGYSDIEVISDNNLVVITEVNETTYSINATEAAEAAIRVSFTAEGGFSSSQSINVSFYEHGIIDFKVIEGIEIDVDTTDKIIDLLGEPDFIIDNESNTEQRWDYTDLGIRFEITLSNNTVDEARIYGIELERENYTTGIYPYEIGNSLSFNDSQLTIDKVLESFGPEYINEASSSTENLFWFEYKDLDIVFFYFAESIEDYSEQVIPYITLY